MNQTRLRSSSLLASSAKVALGGLHHWAVGRTPNWAYQSMVQRFCQDGGKINDYLASAISKIHPPYLLDSGEGVLGDLCAADLDRITRRIDEDGFYVFEQRLPEEMCDRLLQFALTARSLARSASGDGAIEPQSVERFDRAQPRAVRYDFSAQDVIDNADVQCLMADLSIIAAAQAYLRCKPVIDVMSMWWHTAYSKEPDKDAAQFYHFDMDRIKWLKFFIYLTDVGPENGPHCFVRGSHRTCGIHENLRAKGYTRLIDEEVAAYYPADHFVQFTGPRGTILAEDTRGLHKGMHVQQGDRLILQLQFSNSLFGGYYPKAKISRILDSGLAERIREYPKIYATYK